jgi:hypothetical protein
LNFVSPDHYIDVFLHSLTKLRVHDDGLASSHDMADLNAIAMMCLGCRLIAAQGRNIHDVLLAALVDATEALLVTAVMPADSDVVKKWLRARGEYLACRLGAL